MIQKRYQCYTKEGLSWTEWFDISEDDSLLSTFQKEEYQLGKKLKNQYRIV